MAHFGFFYNRGSYGVWPKRIKVPIHPTAPYGFISPRLKSPICPKLHLYNIYIYISSSSSSYSFKVHILPFTEVGLTMIPYNSFNPLPTTTCVLETCTGRNSKPEPSPAQNLISQARPARSSQFLNLARPGPKYPKAVLVLIK